MQLHLEFESFEETYNNLLPEYCIRPQPIFKIQIDLDAPCNADADAKFTEEYSIMILYKGSLSKMNYKNYAPLVPVPDNTYADEF